ncbi:MAG: peptide chain release factor 2 [Alphaproteobacteria bacterium]
MRAETLAVVGEIQQSLALLRRHLDWDQSLRRLDELNALAEDPNLWNKPDHAQKLLRERNELDGQIGRIQKITNQLHEQIELVELAEMESDEEFLLESAKILLAMKQQVASLELESMLSGEADKNECFLEVNAGAGGTEAQDWAEMLLRMYLRWCERKGFKTYLIDETPGEGAGIKSTTIQVCGYQAYGWLKTESGVHRLVRISPFDSNARRHTSFSAVNVAPVIDDNIEVEINDKDLRVDTYRASGSGGQHVNKTDSAVRIVHLPTGIVTASQQERSQHQNRDKAMQMLKSRLYELELKKREEHLASFQGEKTDIGWGYQIRSYVLQPYQLVKDLRTGVETGNPQAVLDGDIDQFLSAALAMRLKERSSEE